MFPIKYFTYNSRGEELALMLRFDIISGKLKKNEIVSENIIAENYKVSRSPVREALKILNNEGLIRQELLGVVILGMTSKDIEELYDVRKVIELFCYKECIKLNKIEQLELALKYRLQRMEISVQNGDYTELTIEDILFHEQIILESEHHRMSRLWDSIKNTLIVALLVANQNRTKVDYSSQLDWHQRLIYLFKKEDSLLLEEVISEHYKGTIEYLQNIFK